MPGEPSTRFGGNLAPHGWFAAKFRALLRDMLVREEGDDLHLMSVVSPAWLKGMVSVKRAPTEFGEVNYELRPEAGGAVLSLQNRWSQAPATLVVHLPESVVVASVSADGKPARVANGAVTIPAGTREARFRWRIKPNAAAFSYAKAVADYKAEYRRRWEKFVRTGSSN